MLEACCLWFVILKKYVELTRPKIESRYPIFFTGTRARSQVSGNDRLFRHGSEFRPNPEIPASPVIQLGPRPGLYSYNLCSTSSQFRIHAYFHPCKHASFQTKFFWSQTRVTLEAQTRKLWTLELKIIPSLITLPEVLNLVNDSALISGFRKGL